MTTTPPTIDELIAARDRFDEALREAVKAAEAHVALADVGTDLEEDSPEFEEQRENAYDERFHCEVCTVRGIYEIFWKPVREYLDVVELAAGHGDPRWNDLV